MEQTKTNATARLGTKAVWSGERGERWAAATQVPVALSVSYGYRTVEEWLDVALAKKPGHVYGRNTNPTVAVFEEKVRDLEDAEAATSFASGMAAISNTLFTLLSPGDRVVSVKDTYGGTNKIFIEFLPRFQIKVELCDTTDQAAIEAAVAKGCKILYLETPTNPTIKVVDVARLAQAAHRHGALVVVDNTFATPINQLPAATGRRSCDPQRDEISGRTCRRSGRSCLRVQRAGFPHLSFPGNQRRLPGADVGLFVAARDEDAAPAGTATK